QRLDTCRIAFEVSRLHLVAEELLVAGAGAEALAGRPAGAFGVARLETEASQLVGGACHLVLDTGDEALDVGPLVAPAGHVERSAPHELERGAQGAHGVG